MRSSKARYKTLSPPRPCKRQGAEHQEFAIEAPAESDSAVFGVDALDQQVSFDKKLVINVTLCHCTRCRYPLRYRNSYRPS